jgi:predicted anti-sigma-YlaC factor YlaD
MEAMSVLSKRCVRAREHISLRLDGELSEFERALLGAHLARCEACRRFEGDVRAVTERLRAEPLEPLSRPIVIAPRRRVALARVLPGAAAAAAVLAVGVGAVLGLANSNPNSVIAGSARAATGFPLDGNNTLLRAVRAKQMRPAAPVRHGVGLPPPSQSS